MGLVREFKEFAVKGNMIDMAVGIIIGGAFGKVVSSLVSDILMPPLGLLMGRMDFSEYKIGLMSSAVSGDGTALPAVDLRFGVFVNAMIDFTIVAFAVFLLVKAINRLRRQQEAAPPPPPPTPEEVLVLRDIRDLLKAKV